LFVSSFSWAGSNSGLYGVTNGENMKNDVGVNSENQTFLDNIASQPGVVKTASGLLYKVVQVGTGEKPTKNSVVTVNYEGKLPDGKIFDSSFKRGEPASFGVSDVISGWTEALQLMSAGSVWELYIPPSLAYGERGVPGVIPPNSVLIFTVDLLKLN
jgi:FKBP-type peptidyl-prolyl cis-trans isomerase